MTSSSIRASGNQTNSSWAAPGRYAQALQVDKFWPWFVGIMLVAFVIRLGLAIAFPNIHRSDEIFQNLEPGFRMWSGSGIVSWEWHDGIRSPLFPGFLGGLMALSHALGFGPSGALAVIAAVLSVISLGTVAVGFMTGWHRAHWEGAVICGVLCAVWPDLIYFGPKTLGEIQAGNLLVIATYLAAVSYGVPAGVSGQVPEDHAHVGGRMFVIGLLLGLVFCLRFQLALALPLVAVWACRLDVRRRWPLMILGGLIPVIAMGASDYYFWGSWFQSIWKNYQLNATEHVAEEFGVSPVYWYVAKFLVEWGAAVVPLAIAFMVGLRRAPLFGLVALVILIEHSAVSHKEISFVYAAIPPAIIVAGVGTLDIVRFLLQRRWPDLRAAAVLATVGLWIAISVTTALGGGFAPRWLGHAGTLRAEKLMAADPELCGIGLRWPEAAWFWTGGDTYLGRSIPFYAFASAAGAARTAPAINYAIGGKDVADGLPGFSVLRCWHAPGEADDTCLARAERGRLCKPAPALDVNNLIGSTRHYEPTD